MTEAHVFQLKHSEIQIFVFHVNNEQQARSKFAEFVGYHGDWIYLGIKQVVN